MTDSRVDRFTALYRHAFPQIAAYAIRRTTSADNAAEAVAETFEIAWRRFDDIPTDRAALLWLYVTARNVLANQSRRSRRREETVARLAVGLGGITPRTDALDDERLEMMSSLASLSSEDREVLMLSGWEGLSASELGRVLDCSPTAARIRLHRARVRLREAMSSSSTKRKQSDSTRHEVKKADQMTWTSEEALEQ